MGSKLPRSLSTSRCEGGSVAYALSFALIRALIEVGSGGVSMSRPIEAADFAAMCVCCMPGTFVLDGHQMMETLAPGCRCNSLPRLLWILVQEFIPALGFSGLVSVRALLLTCN